MKTKNVINLRGLRIRGFVDLSNIPSTVEELYVDANCLSHLLGLDALEGRQLWYLDISGNPLEFELKQLLRRRLSSHVSPLRTLHLSPYQISLGLVGRRYTSHHRVNERIFEEVYQAVLQLMDQLTLDSIVLMNRRPRKIRSRRQGQIVNSPWSQNPRYIPSADELRSTKVGSIVNQRTRQRDYIFEKRNATLSD